MIIYDAKTPEGRFLPADLSRSVAVEPCVTREMTAEEWERYGRKSNLKIRKKYKNVAEMVADVWAGTEEVQPAKRRAKKLRETSTAHQRELAFKLRKELATKDISQNELARRIGISDTSLRNYAFRDVMPLKRSLEKLEAYFEEEKKS